MISIYGAGSFGTALALCLRESEPVRLFYKNEPSRESPFSPELSHRIQLCSDLSLLKEAEILFLTIPTQHVVSALLDIKPYVHPKAHLILCSKGIVCEDPSNRDSFLDKKVQGLLRNTLSILSGPNFAKEIAEGYPMAATLASHHVDHALVLAKRLQTPKMRLYVSTDVIGVLLGGALKNVYAIAAGAVLGKNMGMNIHATLITRSLTEMRRLGLVLGARRETFQSLATLGDLVLTCSHLESRNMRLGYALARGASPSKDVLTEGVPTSKAAFSLAQSLGVSMPILEGVYRVLHEGASIDAITLKMLGEQHHFLEDV